MVQSMAVLLFLLGKFFLFNCKLSQMMIKRMKKNEKHETWKMQNVKHEKNEKCET